jgi:hypothetical protein
LVIVVPFRVQSFLVQVHRGNTFGVAGATSAGVAVFVLDAGQGAWQAAGGLGALVAFSAAASTGGVVVYR